MAQHENNIHFIHTHTHTHTHTQLSDEHVLLIEVLLELTFF